MIATEIIKKVFLPDREKCLEWIRQTRWPKGIKCLYCKSEKIQKHGKSRKGAQRYICSDCGKHFNDLTGTLFHNRKFTIEEMFYIIKESEYKSTNQIAKEIGRDYDDVLEFIRKMQSVAKEYQEGMKLKRKVEIDEKYIKAGRKGQKKERPRKRASDTW